MQGRVGLGVLLVIALIAAACGSSGVTPAPPDDQPSRGTPDPPADSAAPANLILVARGLEQPYENRTNADLWVYAPDGTYGRNLTAGTECSAEDGPSYSDGGRQIVFSSNAKTWGSCELGVVSLWTMAIDGTAPKKLPIQLAGAKFDPTMTADGRWVLFRVQHKDVATGKSFMDLGAYHTQSRRAYYLTSDQIKDYDPTLCSPAPGTYRLAWTRGEGKVGVDLDVWVADFVPGDPPRLANRRNLTAIPNRRTADHDPAWDSTCTKVALHTHRYNDSCHQYLNLPSGVGTAGEIAWVNITVRNPDGTYPLRRVTRGLCNDARPAWSPNDTRLVFSDRRLECNADQTQCRQGNWYLAIATDLDIGSGPESVIRVQHNGAAITKTRRKDWR